MSGNKEIKERGDALLKAVVEAQKTDPDICMFAVVHHGGGTAQLMVTGQSSDLAASLGGVAANNPELVPLLEFALASAKEAQKKGPDLETFFENF